MPSIETIKETGMLNTEAEALTTFHHWADNRRRQGRKFLKTRRVAILAITGLCLVSAATSEVNPSGAVAEQLPLEVVVHNV